MLSLSFAVIIPLCVRAGYELYSVSYNYQVVHALSVRSSHAAELEAESLS